MSLKSAAKLGLFQAARSSGMNIAGRWARRSKLLVLCYHGVVPEYREEDAFLYRTTVSTADFDSQLSILNRCFQPISMQDLLDHVYANAELPTRPVLVTFDDGFRNNLTNAAPLLKKHGIPAVFHVTTGHIGTSRILWPQDLAARVLRWSRKTVPVPGGEQPLPADLSRRAAFVKRLVAQCQALPDEERRAYLETLKHGPRGRHGDGHEDLFQFMTWDEVRQLCEEGFAVGSHTISHPILTRLGTESLVRELEESKKKIEEETGRDCSPLAYPNGREEDFSGEVIKAARAVGYRIAFAVTERINAPPLDRFAVRRYSIGREPIAGFHARISGSYNLFKKALTGTD